MSTLQSLLSGPVSFGARLATTVGVGNSRHSDSGNCDAVSFVDGKAELALSGEKAWHGFGQLIEGAMNSTDALRLSNLGNWNAVKVPLIAQGSELSNGASWNLSDTLEKSLMVRSDTGMPLAVVGNGYETLTHQELFDITDSLCQSGSATYSSAGALEGGRKIFVVLKSPRYIEAGKGDKILPFFTILDSHDGTTSTMGFETSIRVVCRNTYNASLAGKRGGFTIRHTRNMRDRLATAAAAMKYFADTIDREEKDIQAMVRAEMDKAHSLAYFTALLTTSPKSPIKPIDSEKSAEEFGRLLAQPLDVNRSAIDQTYRELRPSDKQWLSELMEDRTRPINTIGGVENSAWSSFCAYTDRIDHARTARGESDADKNEYRFQQNVFGAAAREKVYASAMAVAYASALS